MSEELYHQQLAMENEAVEEAIKKYDELRREKALTDLPPGLAFTHGAFEKFRDALDAYLTRPRGRGRLQRGRPLFDHFELNDVAFIASRRIINSVGTLHEPVQRLALRIADNLIDHLEFKTFEKRHPGYVRTLMDNMQSQSQKYRHRVVTHARHRLEVEDITFKKEERYQFGMLLIDIFMESTGLIERYDKPVRAGHEQICIRWTPPALKRLSEMDDKAAIGCLIRKPMIVPPADWTTQWDGGYLTNACTKRRPIMGTRVAADIHILDDVEMPEVYSALNRIQSVPWRVNERVFDVMDRFWLEGNGVGKLPMGNPIPLPKRPWSSDAEREKLKATNKEVIETWNLQASEIHARNDMADIHNKSLTELLALADEYRKFDRFFFPWTLDWRGRFYSDTCYLHPQGDKRAKALLEFAEGRPVTERSFYWTKMELTGRFGFDKATVDERLAWVDEHEELILLAAENPLDERFWCEADDPYGFLAVCFEWQGLKENGLNHITHLPHYVDGSCNGYQLYSLLLRDAELGAKVNVTPNDTFQDIYQSVCDRANAIVEADALKGNTDAQLWLGKITRSLVKRPTMTFVYGSKGKVPYAKQIAKVVAEKEREDALINGDLSYYLGELTKSEKKSAYLYLGEVLWSTIEAEAGSAVKLMEWFQTAARLIVQKAKKPIHWTTPVGFPAMQAYRRRKYVRVCTMMGQQKIRVGFNSFDKNALDGTKATNIPPNLIHGFDASVLASVINRSVPAFGDLACIHDSFGAHSGDMDTLYSNIRSAVADIFSQDCLYKLYEEFRDQLPPKHRDALPLPPMVNTLEVARVKESTYFFI